MTAVMPAQAGIQCLSIRKAKTLDTRLKTP